MASHSTLPPDTLITAKITINNQTRRFKLALRDLGANVLPNKVLKSTALVLLARVFPACPSACAEQFESR